jgi:hypothetical protein
VTEVMGAGAYAALLEFERITRLIPSAPALADRIALADAAAGRHTAFRAAIGDPASADTAFPQLDEAMRRTEPRDWWEGLITVCLWSPLLRELFAAAADDPSNVPGADAGWAESRLRSAIEIDSALAARLLLWGRRLVGEAIVLAREFGGDQYADQAERLAQAHSLRLSALLPDPPSQE